jgi:poly(3-hydroxybutyrate) depolymerase
MPMNPLRWCLPILFALVAQAASLPSGPSRTELPDPAEPISLFTYKPPTYRGGPLLVICHGVQRNAEDYRNFAITLAERFGALVVAPLFDKERFPLARYQRGGLVGADGKVQPAEKWTYAFIPRIVARVRELEGKPDLPYYLVGHSAGGQFLVRLAAFMPGAAERIIAANAGSHLFPAREADFGYGFGGLPTELSGDDVIRRYLAAPLTLYQGTGDTVADSSMDSSPPAMRQGPNRLARGRAAFATAQALAKARGWEFNWRIVETEGIGHDAAFMFAAKAAGDAIFGK